MAEDAVTVWIKSLQDGNDEAAAKLWNYCFPRLLNYSAGKLPENLRRMMDEEDVALSAFKSFCLGAKKGAFDNLAGRDELWRLLLCIAGRKASNHLRFETREKRGGGRVGGESIFLNAKENGSIDDAAIAEAMESPEILAQFSEQMEFLMDQLGDDELRAIAILRIEGYSVDDISQRLSCAKRTVERRLKLIRAQWKQLEEKA